jgi:hypothetical protein
VNAPSTHSPGVELPLAAFSEAFSRYVDGFLARRSVLDSALFPEKPAQMWFGYETTGGALSEVTAWLRERASAAELGHSFRRLGPHAPGVLPACALWICHAALTGWALEGRAWPSDARLVLDFWRRVYESYSADFTPAGVFISGADAFQHQLIDRAATEDAEIHLDPSASEQAGPTVAAATNYSWLTEAESRQGTYSHGLYETDTGRLLIREFVNLGATRYPWIDRSVADIPGTPVTVVLRLEGVDGDLDIYGVPRLDPQSYSDHVTGVAVKTEDGWVEDPATWMRDLSSELRGAHFALYRTIAGWTPQDRFVAGARSYLAMWAPLLELAGASDADVQRLLFDPLDAAVADRLPEHLARTEPALIWLWAAERGAKSMFSPATERLA